MAVSVTYTATNPTTGASWTRSSGTMEYTHVLLVGGNAEEAAAYSWHKSHAAAFKAANTGYMQGAWPVRTVVPAVPTAVTGKVTQGYVDAWAMDTDNPNAAAIAQLAADKLAAQTAPKARKAAAPAAAPVPQADQAVRNSAAPLTTAAGDHLVRRGGSLGQPLQYLTLDGTTPATFDKLRSAQAAVLALTAQDRWLDAHDDQPTGGALVWTARTPKLGMTAKGAKHVYRTVRTQDGGWWAQQRGTNGSWTPVGGKCPGQAQAQSLAQRYEDGERDLSHKAKRGMTYAQLTPAADQAAS